MEDGLSSDPTRGSRSDFPFNWPGRTIFCLKKTILESKEDNFSAFLSVLICSFGQGRRKYFSVG